MAKIYRKSSTLSAVASINDILVFFRQEMDRLNVDVRYNTALSLELINEINPDKVILATGSMPDMPVIKGLFQTKMDLVTNVDVISGKETTGDRVIVLGGGMSGLIGIMMKIVAA